MRTLPTTKGKQLAKAEILNELFRSSYEGQVFRADKFIANMENMFGNDPKYQSIRKILSPDEMSTLEGLTKLYKQTYDVGINVQRLQGQNALNRLSAGATMSGAAGAAEALSGGGLQNTSKAITFAGGLSGWGNMYLTLLSSEPGRRILMAASRAEPGSKALQAVADRAEAMAMGMLATSMRDKISGRAKKEIDELGAK
jgi:hypothetical protein